MKKTIVVKIGGVASENLSSAFFEQVKTWKKKNYNVIIVHGGGLFISNMMEKLSIPVTKRNGLRVTTPEALAVTRMVFLPLD
jgi:acetylglutamate kinase